MFSRNFHVFKHTNSPDQSFKNFLKSKSGQIIQEMFLFFIFNSVICREITSLPLNWLQISVQFPMYYWSKIFETVHGLLAENFLKFSIHWILSAWFVIFLKIQILLGNFYWIFKMKNGEIEIQKLLGEENFLIL